MREKIHYLKFCMSCSAGQAGHLASPLLRVVIINLGRSLITKLCGMNAEDKTNLNRSLIKISSVSSDMK